MGAIKQLKFVRTMGRLVIQGQRVNGEDIGKAYTKVSAGYENDFLKEMHVYNDQVLEAFAGSLTSDASYLVELACGTGYNSKKLEQVYEQAQFCLVDVSEGMLEQARGKNLKNAIFKQQDMLSFLKAQPDASVDGVICFWAIKYQPPRQIIKEVRRILKPQGVFGVIVNTKQTLPEIRRVYPKLLRRHPEMIAKIMPELPNPSSQKHFLKWFERESFQVLRSETGRKVFGFEDQRALVKWVTGTGALAGFDTMMDLGHEKVRESLIAALEEQKITTVTHDFVWAILRK